MSAVASPTWLWKAKRVHTVESTAQRNELFALWKAGQVTGMFNLPTLDVFRACTDFVVVDDESDVKKLAADVALAELGCAEVHDDLVRATAEVTRLSASNAALASKNKALKAELARMQRADTLKAVVQQNKALVERNRELETQLDESRTRIAALDAASARARVRDPLWDGLLSERSQNDHLNARLLAAFLRNIDGPMETARDDRTTTEEWE